VDVGNEIPSSAITQQVRRPGFQPVVFCRHHLPSSSDAVARTSRLEFPTTCHGNFRVASLHIDEPRAETCIRYLA
jgi:hypothetical protein